MFANSSVGTSFQKAYLTGGIDIPAAHIRQLLDRITGGKSMVDRPEE